MNKNIADLRKDYTLQALNEADVNKNPVVQFEKWLTEAITAKVNEPTAMNVCTVTPQGFPNSRILLLKDVTKDGFSFFTNYQSSKGKEMENNPAVALTFFWPELERQVRIQGMASKLEKEKSEQYFQSRPKASQIGAWSSPQSSVIESREILEERQAKLTEKYKDAEVLPKPEQWGGYLVKPFLIEFWQGRPSRLHDRLVYTFSQEKWQINRLAP